VVCQRPARSAAASCATTRDAASTSAQVSSAGAAGDPLPDSTTTPRAVQAAVSMCGPARPVWLIARSDGRRSSKSRVMRVRSRISTRAWTPDRRAASSAGSLKVWFSTMT
jgi:hypothetical protein